MSVAKKLNGWLKTRLSSLTPHSVISSGMLILKLVLMVSGNGDADELVQILELAFDLYLSGNSKR